MGSWSNEVLIAALQEAACNKSADPHVNAAHARLLAAVINNPPPAFDLFPTADQYGSAKDYLSALATAMDAVVYQVMQEAKANSSAAMCTPDASTVTLALEDAGVFFDLDYAAEALSEESRSDYAEHHTLHRAAQGV